MFSPYCTKLEFINIGDQNPCVCVSSRSGNKLQDVEDSGDVSVINRTLSSKANKLVIFDLPSKLNSPGIYDIGATYSEEDNELKPDLWFYFSTTICPGKKALLSLFVCHRKTGCFSISVGQAQAKLSVQKKPSLLSDDLVSHNFRSTQTNENYHLHTYSFSFIEDDNLKVRESNEIDLKIDMNPTHILNNHVITKIKLKHDFASVLAKQEKTDCFLVHKVFLAAHSPVLRELITSKKSTDNAEVCLDISENEIKLLLEFLYTGTIHNLESYDPFKLLEIADTLKIQNLLFLTQYSLCQQVNVENAVMLAKISEKYNLEKLQSNVFSYIKYNLKVLETDGWKNLDDVNLVKKLFQYMHTEKTN